MVWTCRHTDDDSSVESITREVTNRADSSAGDGAAQRRARSPALTDPDVGQPQRRRHRLQLKRQRRGATRAGCSPASVNAPTTFSVPGAVGLEVDPSDQSAVEQERPHVVAELTLGLRACKSLCGSGIEQALDPRPEEDQRVERAQQRRPAVTPRHDLARPQVGRARSSRRPRPVPAHRRRPAWRSPAWTSFGDSRK